MAHATRDRRKVPLRVLSLGYSKTGTMTMQAALQKLGYGRVYHGWDTVSNADECKLWEKAIDAKFFGIGKPWRGEDFDSILGDCRAVTDIPCVLFADELIAAYPEAKVVLVEREVESWYRSLSTAVVPAVFSPVSAFIMNVIDPLLGYNTVIVSKKSLLAFFKARNRQEILENARGAYLEYYAHIREIVPPERLLNFELASGWKPLCDFLGDEVPDEPFPRVNESEVYKKEVQEAQIGRYKEGFARLMKKISLPLLVGAGAGAVYWYQRMRQ